jgi:transposase
MNQLQGLVEQTGKLFDMKEISADKGYSSKENLRFIWEAGAVPFIPFKSNTVSTSFGIWGKMYKFFMNYPEQFGYHYHKRSNVETTFHMLKRKFGDNLRSKYETGQTNEILAKCLTHNLCVLVQEAFELGIEIDFKKCAEVPFAHK